MRRKHSPVITAVMVLLMAVAAVFGKQLGRSIATNSPPAHEQIAPARSDASTTARASIEPDADDAAWSTAEADFEASHADLKLGINAQIMQAALNRLAHPTIDYRYLLDIAYIEAVRDPRWTRQEVSTASSQGSSWEIVSAAFVESHSDIGWGGNHEIMQKAINLIRRADPGVSSQSLLAQAYARARVDPEWWRLVQNDAAQPSPVTLAPQLPASSAPTLAVENQAIQTFTVNEISEPAQASTPAWMNARVQDVPGAVMTGPNQALNPYNGRVFDLAPERGNSKDFFLL